MKTQIKICYNFSIRNKNYYAQTSSTPDAGTELESL